MLDNLAARSSWGCIVAVRPRDDWIVSVDTDEIDSPASECR